MIGGRILDVSAIVGFATSMPYPQAVVFTALEQNVVLAIPSGALAEAWAQGEPRQSDTVFASPCTFESWPAVPTRVLIGRDDRFLPADFQRRIAHERLGISADEMPGGHLVALSQPEELAARLEAYATDVVSVQG